MIPPKCFDKFSPWLGDAQKHDAQSLNAFRLLQQKANARKDLDR